MDYPSNLDLDYAFSLDFKYACTCVFLKFGVCVSENMNSGKSSTIQLCFFEFKGSYKVAKLKKNTLIHFYRLSVYLSKFSVYFVEGELFVFIIHITMS